jgi:hypothetical protein
MDGALRWIEEEKIILVIDAVIQILVHWQHNQHQTKMVRLDVEMQRDKKGACCWLCCPADILFAEAIFIPSSSVQETSLACPYALSSLINILIFIVATLFLLSFVVFFILLSSCPNLV